MITKVNSRVRFYREVIQGVEGQSTTHNRLRMKSGGSYLDLNSSLVTSNVAPVSGSLASIVSAGGLVSFGVDKLVTVQVDLRTIREVETIEIKHAESGTFRKVLIQASTDGMKWYTLWDSNLDGLYAETLNGSAVNVFYEIDTDERSGIIKNVEDYAPFDPKQMIWDNDKKLLEYFEALISKCQHYKLASSSTSTAVVLENEVGLYPHDLFDNMMVYWVQTSTADTVSSVTLKVGNLSAKSLVVQGSDTVTLNEGEPYIAIYNSKEGKFKLLSGGGSGLASKIATVQSTSGFSKFDLGAFDKASGSFIAPDLTLAEPILADAILVPRSFGFEGFLGGLVEITGMKDYENKDIESGEVYFVYQDNPKKVTKVQPSGGWVQPIFQTFMSKGKLYAEIMETETFSADDSYIPTVGRGLRFVDGVMEVEAVDGAVNESNPSFEKMVTEKDLVEYVTPVKEDIDFNLLATLGIEYGGILNNTNAKVSGKAYYDTTGKKLYKCIANTSINYADAGFFEALSNNDLLGKLQNLQDIKLDKNKITVIYGEINKSTGDVVFTSPNGPYSTVIIGIKLRRLTSSLAVDYPPNTSMEWSNNRYPIKTPFTDLIEAKMIAFIL